MIKIELSRCCMQCEYSDLEIEEMPYLDMRYMATNKVIRCRHAHVCGKYMSEPLQALPVEQLFKGE